MVLLLILTFAVVVYTVVRNRRCKTAVIRPKEKISQINTLLHNIEVYDGTPKGQKQIGGNGF